MLIAVKKLLLSLDGKYNLLNVDIFYFSKIVTTMKVRKEQPTRTATKLSSQIWFDDIGQKYKSANARKRYFSFNVSHVLACLCTLATKYRFLHSTQTA